MNFDVVVVGSGIIGATAALLLAKNSSLNIAVIEAKEPCPYQPKEQYDYRVSAISPASKNILQRLAVWDSIQQKRVTPYHKMTVWDEAGQGAIYFDCDALHQPVLGYIIEDNIVRSSLLEKFSQYSNLHFLHPIKLISLHDTENHIELQADKNEILSAKLVIGSDGANSWVREKAGIELKSWDYQHTAVVATVQTERSHQATAWQRFLSSGPLAFLPLNNPHYCSIVWSTSHQQAENLLSLSEIDFCNSLGSAFDFRLGKILSTQSRHAFPLRMRHAKQYVCSRVALIGDAAHTIHPMAGQGVNLGFLDAASLAEVVVTAVKKNRDFSSLATLRRYERWRKTDTLAMLAMVEGLKHLFASEQHWIQVMRNAGLNFTNRLLFLKYFFANYASGRRGDMPKIAVI